MPNIARENEGPSSILVNGRITKHTASELKSLLARRKKEGGSIFVQLNSPGGDLESSIEAGYLFRQYEVFASVPEGSTCVSACVYLLAGATSRVVYGQVGIHRPYDPADNIQTAQEQKKKYDRWGKKIRKFFHAVNIPVTLYDEMLRIAPRSVKYLSKDDLSRTGLGEDDPYFAEANSSKSAKTLSITKQELERRMNYVNTICANYKNYDKSMECANNVFKSGHE